jgi:aminoglycoside phosphotransferase family enzyme/predicted kinase
MDKELAMVPTDVCRVRETHVSILLFLGDRVLKLHKPLRFDFADFSTPSARAADCQREVDLNRRLAPDVYLGVAEVIMGSETLEHCVVMRRLPAGRSLDHIVRSEAEPGWDRHLRKVAETLVSFHTGADRSDVISNAASIEAVARQFEANVTATAPFIGAVLEPGVHETVVRAVRRYLSGRGPLFAVRIAADQICDGHGDLQAGDIYCLDDGPRILDCLEFDDELRYGDVAADVAFLAMDLERLGAPSAAERFVRHYEESAGAPLPPSLLHLYTALRAYVRVKVACLRHEQGDPLGVGEAATLLALAQAHLEQARVRLVLVGGLPGSGKSTLAAGLGTAVGATVLRSDVIRQHLLRPEASHLVGPVFGTGRYGRGMTRGVYAAMVDAARTELGLGRTAILDASWIERSHRDEARRLADECDADLIELYCSAPSALREQRIKTRLQQGSDPSEATVEVARSMAHIESSWTSATVIDTTREPKFAVTEALRVIGAQSRTFVTGPQL